VTSSKVRRQANRTDPQRSPTKLLARLENVPIGCSPAGESVVVPARSHGIESAIGCTLKTSAAWG